MEDEQAGGGSSAADEAVVARLGDLFRRYDPPPDLAVRLARQSFGLRAVDAELAALVADSAVDRALVEVRGAGTDAGPRLLTFEAGELAVEVEVDRAGRLRRLLGQLLPAGPARIEARQPSAVAESRWVDADDRGRFAIEGLEPGPVSLTCHRPQSRPVTTPWTTLD